MLLGENIQLAFASLKANKIRAFLTMLGIIIGISAVIAIFTVGNSLTLSISDNMQSAGANDIYVNVMPRSEEKGERDPRQAVDGIRFAGRQTRESMQESDYISDAMVKGLVDYLGDRVRAVVVWGQSGNVKLSQKTGRQSADVNLLGVNAGFFLNHPNSIQAGRMFSAEDFTNQRRVALIAKETAEKMFGDRIQDALNQEIEMSLDGKTYGVTIVGVYQSESRNAATQTAFAGSSFYIPIGTYNQMMGKTGGRYRMIQVIAVTGHAGQQLDQKQNQEELTAAIDTYFKPYYRNNPNYQAKAVTFGGLVNMLMTMLGTITTAISIIAGIALLVGGIGVMNIMLVSVAERTREIGTRKALGARNSSIRAQFIVEAMIICLIGGLIGVILGITLGVAASQLLGYPARPSLGGILIALGFSMGIGIFFGYFPASKAARMNPIDALRYE